MVRPEFGMGRMRDYLLYTLVLVMIFSAKAKELLSTLEKNQI